MATEIDCTEAREAAKHRGQSFFLYYLYAVVRAANEVDELRYRIDKQKQVVFHDRVDIITPIACPAVRSSPCAFPITKVLQTFMPKPIN